MLGLPNNDKDFTHTQVGKIGLVFLTLKHLKSQRLYNHLNCLDCLTMLKNKHTHTHTCRQKLKFQNCIQHTILTK
jgi:hypothetical protein